MANTSFDFAMHIVSANVTDIQLNVHVPMQLELQVLKVDPHRLATFDQLASFVGKDTLGVSNVAGESGERQQERGRTVVVHQLDLRCGCGCATEYREPHLDCCTFVVA